MIRKAAVSGSFYPGGKRGLEEELAQYIVHSENKKKVIGLISPHAGYIYSGGCAGKGFGGIRVPDVVVILGVNHRGIGVDFAVDGHEKWNTPLGDITVDGELSEALVTDSSIFRIDSTAGSMEHSLEVQVPFIQYLNSEAKIVAITISSMNFEQILEGGKELGRLLKGREDVLMVASTDMSHYVDAESARVSDQLAIDKILAMDPGGLLETVVRNRISMCGVSPTAMMLRAAMELGAGKSELVQYTNSGEVSGDFRQVVGYLSMTVV
ncbi:MAG: AmmeMemoRadiSam system protein B [bacterium]|nr:AmmeMemoRadiSam system protein B [bacterium]